MDAYVDELGHEYTSYVSNNDATCTAEGTETAICNRIGCEETHTQTDVESMLPHTFDKEVAENQYFANEATCASKAAYYYSCECGARGEEIFTYGDVLPHPMSNTWSYNETHHWNVSTCEHDVIENKNEHDFGAENQCVCGLKSGTVIWENYDGSILEIDENVAYGAIPTYDGEMPVKRSKEPALQQEK